MENYLQPMYDDDHLSYPDHPYADHVFSLSMNKQPDESIRRSSNYNHRHDDGNGDDDGDDLGMMRTQSMEVAADSTSTAVVIDDADHIDTSNYYNINGGDDKVMAAAKIINRRSGHVMGGNKKQEEEQQVVVGHCMKMRKQRYAFQTRSQVDILDDGYRWRKYGQKAVKNNRFPRSYYRCTFQGCNVKKQVQRLSKDEEVVVTTYEGVHSHSIERSTDNFEHILSQMQIYTSC